MIASAQPSAAVLPSASAPAPAIAAALLDEGIDQKQREALARDVAGRAAEVVDALVRDLPRDEDEEYRRIPWIWRVSVAAGRSTDAAVLKPLLDLSMPQAGEPLRDWQAVVLGGGIVMGLSQGGQWPGEAMAPWLAADATRAARWARSLDLAVTMSDDPKVRNGTRYDALRMLALVPWDRASDVLRRYLAADVDAELQAGAIGGLADTQDDRVGSLLLANVAAYAPGNRRHLVNALLRTEARRAQLREAMARGVVPADWLTPEQRQTLG